MVAINDAEAAINTKVIMNVKMPKKDNRTINNRNAVVEEVLDRSVAMPRTFWLIVLRWAKI